MAKVVSGDRSRKEISRIHKKISGSSFNLSWSSSENTPCRLYSDNISRLRSSSSARFADRFNCSPTESSEISGNNRCETAILPKPFLEQRPGDTVLANLNQLLLSGGVIYLKTPGHNTLSSQDFQKEVERKTGWIFIGTFPAEEILAGQRGFVNMFEK
jgi:hypothetical protein